MCARARPSGIAGQTLFPGVSRTLLLALALVRLGVTIAASRPIVIRATELSAAEYSYYALVVLPATIAVECVDRELSFLLVNAPKIH